jgi:hypothetical protein
VTEAGSGREDAPATASTANRFGQVPDDLIDLAGQ